MDAARPKDCKVKEAAARSIASGVVLVSPSLGDTRSAQGKVRIGAQARARAQAQYERVMNNPKAFKGAWLGIPPTYFMSATLWCLREKRGARCTLHPRVQCPIIAINRKHSDSIRSRGGQRRCGMGRIDFRRNMQGHGWSPCFGWLTGWWLVVNQ